MGMKLIANTDGEKGQKPVVISVEQEDDTVAILANGEQICYFDVDGKLHLSEDTNGELEDMGFELDRDDYIDIEKD